MRNSQNIWRAALPEKPALGKCFCKGCANTVALLGLSESQLSLFVSVRPCRDDFAVSVWLLELQDDFQNLPNAGGPSPDGGLMGRKWASLFQGASRGSQERNIILFFFFFLFPEVLLLKDVLNGMVRILRCF